MAEITDAKGKPSRINEYLALELGEERKRANRLARECAEWEALATHLWSMVAGEGD